MVGEEKEFKDLFLKFRLKSGFSTLSEFGEVLSREGFIYEDSLFSRWQKGTRTPRDRKLLITLVKIFIKRGGLTNLKEANSLLVSAEQGYLTEIELFEFSKFFTNTGKRITPKKILDFSLIVGESKLIKRTGWIREKIKGPESVAEHSFRLSVMAMVISDILVLDKDKLIKMAIMHDLGEVITGDIVVWISGEVVDIKKHVEKEKLEKKGIEKIFKVIGKSKEYVKIFEEMTERATQEAKIFWQLDKLEMAIQALEYEKKQGKDLSDFFVTADLEIHSPYLKKIMKEILKQRNKKKKL